MLSMTCNAVALGSQRKISNISRMILLCIVIPGTIAAGYPERPVRLIVPAQPSGGADITMRLIATKLTEYLGGEQMFLVEDRPGASGTVGAAIIARAAPDGYTLGSIFASHTSNSAVKKDIPYNVVRDFAPISLAATLPSVLVSHPSFPPKTVKELIAFVKARPGQLQYATPGVGSNAHLTIALFLSMTKLQMIHIPYKSTSMAAVDVIAGNVPLFVANMLVTMPHIKAGKLHPYGVTSAVRSRAAPEIPTIAEMGLPGFEAFQWYGVVAPAGTPREIITRLHAGIVRALQDPAVRKRLIADGAGPTPSASPEEFGAFIKAETAKWAKIVKTAGIQPE